MLRTDDPFGGDSTIVQQEEAAYCLALTATAPSDALRKALREWQTKREAVTATENKIRHASERIDGLRKETARLSAQAGPLPKDSGLHRRYLTMLATYEDEIIRLRDDRQNLTQALESRKAELHAYLLKLEVK